MRDIAAGRCQAMLQCHREFDHPGNHDAIADQNPTDPMHVKWPATAVPIFAPISVSLMLDSNDARTFTDADAASLGLHVIDAARRKLAEGRQTTYDRSLLEIEADYALYFAAPTSPTIDYVDTQWRLVHDIPGLLQRIRLLLKQRGDTRIIDETVIGYRVRVEGHEYMLRPEDVDIVRSGKAGRGTP
jgi:hypothetical protein